MGVCLEEGAEEREGRACASGSGVGLGEGVMTGTKGIWQGLHDADLVTAIPTVHRAVICSGRQRGLFRSAMPQCSPAQRMHHLGKAPTRAGVPL